MLAFYFSEKVSTNSWVVPPLPLGDAAIPDLCGIQMIGELPLLVIVPKRAIVHILAGNLFDGERAMPGFSFRHLAGIRAVGNDKVYCVSGQTRQP